MKKRLPHKWFGADRENRGVGSARQAGGKNARTKKGVLNHGNQEGMPGGSNRRAGHDGTRKKKGVIKKTRKNPRSGRPT